VQKELRRFPAGGEKRGEDVPVVYYSGYGEGKKWVDQSQREQPEGERTGEWDAKNGKNSADERRETTKSSQM